MQKENFKFIFAPLGVAAGIFFITSIMLFISRQLHIERLQDISPFLVIPLLKILGAVIIILFLPLFIAGIYSLGRRRAAGEVKNLETGGIYKYVRNPMYSGISNTIIGIGFLVNKTGVILAGLVWLLITIIQATREERQLTQKFGQAYLRYKEKTPGFFPGIKVFYGKRSKQ